MSLKFFGSKPMINQDLSLAWTQFQRRADRAESAVKLKSVSEDLLLSAERDDVRMTLPFLY